MRIGVAAAAATILLGIGTAHAQSPGAEIKGRASTVLAGDDYQTEHPGRAKFTPPAGGGGLGDLPLPLPGGGGQGSAKDQPGGTKEDPRAGDPDPPRQSTNDDPRSISPGDPGGSSGDRSERDGPRNRGKGDSGGFNVPSRRRSAPPPVVDPGGPSMFGLVAMSLLGAVLVLLLVLGASAFLRSREKEGSAGEAEGELPQLGGGAAAESSLSEVDALAREGRFAEAVHVLFQITVNMLARGGRLVLEDAMTGREALGRARLDDGGRAALRDLVGVVETSLFGGGAVDADQYRQCVASYQRLTTAGESGNAPGFPTAAAAGGAGA
jgi:Domain of unknown function (DUF4129)